MKSDLTGVCVLCAQSCPTLCNPADCSPPGSSSILKWGTGVGCHFPPPGDLPDPGIKPVSRVSLILLANSLPAEPSGKPNSG